MDQTDLENRFHLLFIALAFRKRAIPILWTRLDKEGRSGADTQIKLLLQVATLLPAACREVVYADCEYGSGELLRFLQRQGWFFVIRMKNLWRVMSCQRHFQLGEVSLRRGTVNFEDGVCLRDLPALRLSLNCAWSSLDPDDKPWYLLSNLQMGKDILNRYARRFWIEEMFRDFKEQGFRLDKTHLQAGERVEALLLCVCLAYTWTRLYGVELEQSGKCGEIDRANKPQLSLFQFALHYLKRLSARGQEFPRQFRLSTPKYEG